MLHVNGYDTGCMMVFVKVLSHVLYSLSQSIFRVPLSVPHRYHIDVVPGIPDVHWDFVKSTTSLVPK